MDLKHADVIFGGDLLLSHVPSDIARDNFIFFVRVH